jgi:cell division protein FtsW
MITPGIGIKAQGARRALPLPGLSGVRFQPAELAKVVMVVWLAAIMTRPGIVLRLSTKAYLLTIASAGLLIGLTIKEDFGTAALMSLVLGFMLIIGRARWRHIFISVLIASPGFYAAVRLVWYRWERIRAFYFEEPDPQGLHYQVTQGLIAIGSGGWFGKGLGAGVQKYGYIPHDDNDFIFAVICEELGAVAGLAVILLFLAFLWRGFYIAWRARDPHRRLLAAGLTLLICMQAAFNIAVVTMLVPTKGISLPFVSAGGSGVICLAIAAGLIASAGRRESELTVERRRRAR